VLRPKPESGSYGGQENFNAYPPQYAGTPQQNYTTPGGGNFVQPGGSYTAFPQQTGFQPPYQQQEAARAQEAAMALETRNARGRTTGMVLILIGLLFILTAAVLFTLQRVL
jgi:hypothetical protein